ncbi:MAG TPA: hypothetical protein PK205_14895 [Promineifilum sp.]|nr:hypothetical protein [Promineifilum sp.]HRQ14588.1 hypothetical protein [Promineifilum sp.]
MSPLSILTHATRRCWDEWISVVLASALWLMAQALIITGPPATAALFAAARNTDDGVYWGAADLWRDFRALFVPAWKWGLLNLLVIGPALYNLSVFWSVPGVWQWLRPVWLVGLLVWLGLNLFYWPLWLAAEDKSIRNTYANCVRFWLLHPVAALVLFAICLAAALLLMPFALPIVLGVVFWIALVAETAVRQSLEGMTAGRSE